MDGSLVICKVVCCRDFFYSNGWYPCHYGRQSVVEIFVTPMDCSFVIMEDSILSRFLLLHWMEALSLWKVVCCGYLCCSNGCQPCHYGQQSIVEIFVTQMDGSLVITEGCLLSIFLLLHWMVSLSFGRQYVVDIFFTPMDDSLVIMEGSLLSRFLLLQWMVTL